MEDMRIKTCFDIDKEDLEKIDELVEKDVDRSRAYYFRKAIKKFLENRG